MEAALQSSVYVSSPEFAGWLSKRGFRWRKLWKKRWVALHGAEIVYMDQEPTLENSSNMTITKAQITTATVIDREDLEGNPNGFAIHINDGQTPTWYLRAESAREKKSWLMRLSHVHTIVRWLEDFEKVKVLGVGGTGIVHELLHKSNGQRFAMKEMEIKNKAQMQMAISEAEMLKDIMENVSHPNVMHIEKVFQVGSKFYLVFPLCTGGELYEHIIRRGHFTERDAALLTRDLISGLHALHSHDILHLDIKPENLLFDTMADDAKIKITDFGLSKLFTPSDSSKSSKDGHSSSSKFSPQIMEDKLRVFLETGELNRDRLRGTIGYMSPELILCGHCSKATDVFAAGVVLYILLCGRPPFNSKSNREVLEKTARGQYSMTGSEWEDISDEAKDLVRRMLVVNPDERISCEEILSHPWLRALDELDMMESSSDASSSVGNNLGMNSLSPALSQSASQHSFSLSQSKQLSSSSAAMHFRKGSSLSNHNNGNLVHALRHLSGHVKQRQSEKLASSVTRSVSLMQQGNGGKRSTLAAMYLIPMSSSDIELIAKTASTQADEGELDTILLSSDFKEGLARALHSVSGEYGHSGRLSTEQFTAILRHFYGIGINSSSSNNSASSNGSSSGGSSNHNAYKDGASGANNGSNIVANVGMGGLAPLIVARFLDRDGDGYITADDIFAAQAQVLQRSELFLKVVFRIYCEAIWYPGRQLNLQWMLSQQSSAVYDDSKAGSAGSVATPVKVLSDETSSCLNSVVEPPRFITQRHVAAVFEKLGYDPSCAHKVFVVLAEAVARLKHAQQSMLTDGSSSKSGDYNGMQSTNFGQGYGSDEDDETEVGGKNTTASSIPTATAATVMPPAASLSTPNLALAKAFGDLSVAAPSVKAKEDNSLAAEMAAPSSVLESSTPATAPLSSSASASLRMDFQDFRRAVELDDVLLQAVFRKSRYRVMSLLKEAEIRRVSGDANEALDDNSGSSSNRTSKRRPSCKDIATSLFEEELKGALRAVSDNSNRPKFPIANAVGRATFSAAMNIARGAQALLEATTAPREATESIDSDVRRSSLNLGTVTTGVVSPTQQQRVVDSDDEV